MQVKTNCHNVLYRENSETESEKMMDEAEVEKEFENNMSALKTWFQLDENAIPPVYQLQSIRSVTIFMCTCFKKQYMKGT